MPSFTILTVTKSAERATNLLDLVAGEGSPIPQRDRHLFFFTTEESYVRAPTNVLAAVWRSADRPDERCAIIGSPLPRR